MFLQFVHLMKKPLTQERERKKIMWGPGNPFSLEQALHSAFLRSSRGCGHSWLRDLYWFKEEGWTVQMISVPLYQLAHTLSRAQRDSIGIFHKGSVYFVNLHSYSCRMHTQTWHATVSVYLACRTMTPGQAVYLPPPSGLLHLPQSKLWRFYKSGSI